MAEAEDNDRQQRHEEEDNDVSIPKVSLDSIGDKMSEATSASGDADDGKKQVDRSEQQEEQQHSATATNDDDTITKIGRQKRQRTSLSPTEQQPLPSSSSSSSMMIESSIVDDQSAQLCSSLEELLENVKSMVSSLSENGDDITSTSSDYSHLYDVALSAYNNLSSFGDKIEMGRILPIAATSSSISISTELREKLRNIGRNLWMTIRSHSNVFVDKSTSDSSESAIARGSSTGLVRLIAARLVLIDYISTNDPVCPTLLIEKGVRGKNTGQLSNKLPIATPNELEFGLRSFIRAGRAILPRGDVAKVAYGALVLAQECWYCINLLAKGGGDGEIGTAMAAASVASKNLDDAFDGAALLPDACHSAVCTVQVNRDRASRQVLLDLERLDQFVRDYCVQSQSESGISLSAIQRYLPCVARVAYKHGNRFAQCKNFSCSKGALEIVLKATNDCLRGIRSRVKESSLKNVCQALQVQETEMLVVAKQCLYVLSHVSLETGQAQDATSCLDHIDKYIDEERSRSDEQYTAMMRNLNNDSKSKHFPMSFAGSNLLEAPKDQDKADIIARIETARIREKQTELKERANLAFSRIMLYHQSSRMGREDGRKVDAQFKTLADLVLSIPDSPPSATTSATTTTSPFAVAATTNRTKTRGTEMSEEVFAELLLRAAREIRARRLVASITVTNDASCASNPYETLLDKVDKRHPKHLFVVLDHLRAVLTAIQMLREKHNNDSIVFSPADIDLDALALTIAKQYVQGFESQQSALASSTKRRSIASESTLFEGSDNARNLRSCLLQESRTQFSRALALYHCADDRHEICHQWADFLIESLQLVKGESNGTAGSHAVTGNDETLAELFAIKAYSLSMSGKYTLGLRTARKAWETSERSNKPSIHSFGILFHAALLQETRGAANGENSAHTSSCNTLLEVDSAVSCLLQAYGGKTMESGLSIGEELMESFKTFCGSCVEHEKTADGGGRLILGVQERWMKSFGKTDSIIDLLKNGAPDDGSFAQMPGGASLLTILRNYLTRFQGAMSVKASREAIQPQALDSALESVLYMIRIVRDRKLPTSRSKKKHDQKQKRKKALSDSVIIEGDDEMSTATADYALMWDDHATNMIIGEHADCIWIAEQLWSMASLFLSDKWTMSQLYARSHDFALLSEEEEGAKLTDGYLDCDYGCTADMQAPDFSRSGTSNGQKIAASALSSEFSSWCLIMSVASVVDDIEAAKSANKDWAKLCLHRLALAYNEMEVNELHDEQNRKEVRPMVAHLTLRCLVELGDDERARAVLSDGSLLKCLCEGNVAQAYDEDDNDGDANTESDFSIEPDMEAQNTDLAYAINMLQNLYSNAARAETNGLPETAKMLLGSCVAQFEGCSRNESGGAQSTQISIGQLQRKLIELASNVQETVAVFEAVDASVMTAVADLTETGGNGGGETNLPYTKDQLDWYAVEAHNRACNLMSLGDIPNASRLMAIALNILPFTSKSVASYGGEMRNTYSKLSSHSGDRHQALTHGNIVDLFCGNGNS